MNGVQGAIHFVVTGDETDLLRALSSSRSAIIASGDTAEKEGAKIEQMFKRATSSVFAFFSAAQATSFVKSMATVHGEFQQIEIALETILGNEREAATLMNQLRETAAKTPFDMKGIANGAKQLLAYGEDAATVNETLIKLGNIAAGLSQPLGDLVYLYGTTMTQGRLYTQDFNQFVGRGIPMIKELAEYFGVAESEVRGLVEAGKVGFPEVQAVISSLTEEGGMFFNLMEKQSTSVIGKISNLGDAWDAALDKMGESSEGFIYTGIEGLTYLVEHYDTVLKILGTLVTAYGSYKAALIAINAIQKVSATVAATRALLAQTQMLTRATQAQILFNQAVKANPYVLAFSALTTVITALAMFCDKSDEAEESVSRLESANKKASEEFDKEAAKIKSLQDIVSNSNVAYDERKKALDRLREIVPDYNASLSKEGELLNNNTDAIKEYLVQLERQIKLKAAQEELEEAYKEQRELQREWDDAFEDLSNKRTNSAYYDDPIVDVAGMFGQRDLQKAEERFKDIDSRLSKVNKTIEELNSEIAETSVGTSSSSKSFKTFSEQLEDAKNKVETLKKELKDLLAGKGNEESFVKAIEDKRKELKAAQDAYDTLRGIDPQSKKSVSSSTTDYKTKIANEGRELERLYKDMELSIQRARIDAMDDSLEKVLAESEFNHKAELEAIERQKEDTLRKIQEQEKTIWESENPDWKKKGLTFTPATTELPKEIADKFDKLTEISNQKAQDAISKYLSAEFDNDVEQWNEYYKKYGTFRERLQATKDEYDAKMQKAKTEGEKTAIQAEMDAVLADFELEASGYVEELANKTIGQLGSMLKIAKTQLDDAKRKFNALGSSTSTEANEYRQVINKLEAQIKALNAQLNKAKGHVADKDWAKAANLFQTIGSGAQEAAESVRVFDEGLAEVLKTVANLATGVGAMIAAIQGIGAAVSAAEKASAILAAISAAIQVVSGLFSIFSGGETSMERNIRLFQELNDEIERLKRESAINSWDGTIFNQDLYRNASENMKVYVEAMERYSATLERIRTRGIEKTGMLSNTEKANLWLDPGEWESAASSIWNMKVQTRHSTWFRSAKYASLGSLLPSLFNSDGSLNMDALKEFQGSDLYNKLTKENRALIDDLIADWELYEEALDEVKSYLTDIFGELGGTMTDALVDAFANGTDAAKAFTDSVSDMLEKLAEDMIYSVTLAPIMEKAQEDMLNAMGDANLTDEEKFKRYVEILANMTGDAISQQDNFNELLEKYQEIAKRYGLDVFAPDESAGREASQRGIATASQESVDENNGRLTVIQGHTYTINENVKTLVILGDKMLEAINAVRANTEYCQRLYKLDKLDNIENQIGILKNTVDEIIDNGLKVK